MKYANLTPDEQYYLTWLDEMQILMDIRPPCVSRFTFLRLMASMYDRAEEEKRNPNAKKDKF